MTAGRTPPPNPLRDAALELARNGMFVFPLRPGGKQPLPGSHGFEDATTDEAIIRRWWSEHPTANVGLSCGPSGIIAVDVDVKDGKDGLTSWRTVAGNLGIPENGTLTNHTPTGGLHLLYRQPDGDKLGNSKGKLGVGLDARVA